MTSLPEWGQPEGWLCGSFPCELGVLRFGCGLGCDYLGCDCGLGCDSLIMVLGVSCGYLTMVLVVLVAIILDILCLDYYYYGSSMVVIFNLDA